MTEQATATVRWCIETEDRIGMVRDIMQEVARHEGNIEALEVVAHVVYIRLRLLQSKVALARAIIRQIAGVKSMTAVDTLPFESDEQTLVKRLMRQDPADGSPLSFANLVYRSPVMQKIVQMSQTIADRDVPVLITGESGTGKELLARAIHQASRRSRMRFVPVNCAAIPESLLESELFGYADGAFTGAKRGGRLGLFELASQGTLFLDEIGEMNPAVQAKLLRALSEGEIRRVGESTARRVDVRILAATNRNLPALVETEQFRLDLFYRLNVIPLKIPPLRERREDIVPIAISCVDEMSQRLERNFVLDEGAVDALLQYDFPGNVRELQNMIERACYLADGYILKAEHLLMPQRQEGAPAVRPGLAEGRGLRARVEQYEQEIIEQAILRCGSLRAAAKELGVSHTTLINKRRHWQSG